MARSPEAAAAKAAANENVNNPTKVEGKGRRLKAPDGFVYDWTEALSKQPGFVEFDGETNEGGFAKE
jgi:hypothetical protein